MPITDKDIEDFYAKHMLGLHKEISDKIDYAQVEIFLYFLDRKINKIEEDLENLKRQINSANDFSWGQFILNLGLTFTSAWLAQAAAGAILKNLVDSPKDQMAIDALKELKKLNWSKYQTLSIPSKEFFSPKGYKLNIAKLFESHKNRADLLKAINESSTGNFGELKAATGTLLDAAFSETFQDAFTEIGKQTFEEKESKVNTSYGDLISTIKNTISRGRGHDVILAKDSASSLVKKEIEAFAQLMKNANDEMKENMKALMIFLRKVGDEFVVRLIMLFYYTANTQGDYSRGAAHLSFNQHITTHYSTLMKKYFSEMLLVGKCLYGETFKVLPTNITLYRNYRSDVQFHGGFISMNLDSIDKFDSRNLLYLFEFVSGVDFTAMSQGISNAVNTGVNLIQIYAGNRSQKEIFITAEFRNLQDRKHKDLKDLGTMAKEMLNIYELFLHHEPEGNNSSEIEIIYVIDPIVKYSVFLNVVASKWPGDKVHLLLEREEVFEYKSGQIIREPSHYVYLKEIREQNGFDFKKHALELTEQSFLGKKGGNTHPHRILGNVPDVLKKYDIRLESIPK